MSVIGNLSAALEQDLRRRRVLGVQFREHLLDQMLVAVARIRACLVPHHNRPGHRDHLLPIQSRKAAETHPEGHDVPAPGCSWAPAPARTREGEDRGIASARWVRRTCAGSRPATPGTWTAPAQAPPAEPT